VFWNPHQQPRLLETTTYVTDHPDQKCHGEIHFPDHLESKPTTPAQHATKLYMHIYVLRHRRHADDREAVIDLLSDLACKLLDGELGVWIHGSQLLLPSGEVLVIL
jgi:hypothetical protein